MRVGHVISSEMATGVTNKIVKKQGVIERANWMGFFEHFKRSSNILMSYLTPHSWPTTFALGCNVKVKWRGGSLRVFIAIMPPYSTRFLAKLQRNRNNTKGFLSPCLGTWLGKSLLPYIKFFVQKEWLSKLQLRPEGLSASEALFFLQRGSKDVFFSVDIGWLSRVVFENMSRKR